MSQWVIAAGLKLIVVPIDSTWMRRSLASGSRDRLPTPAEPERVAPASASRSGPVPRVGAPNGAGNSAVSYWAPGSSAFSSSPRLSSHTLSASVTLQNRMNDCNSRQVVFCRLRSCRRRARPWASGSNAIAVTIPTSVAYCPPNGPEKGSGAASDTRSTGTSKEFKRLGLCAHVAKR